MESLYAEVVVKPRQPILRNIVAGVICFMAIAFFVLACRSSFVYKDLKVVFWSIPMEITIISLTTFFYRRGKIEYEYIFCDDVMTIAKITNKSKRKNIASIETDNIELFAKADSKEMERWKQLPKADFASAKKRGDVYAAVTVYKGTKVRLLVEPSEKLMYCMKMKLGTRYVAE